MSISSLGSKHTYGPVGRGGMIILACFALIGAERAVLAEAPVKAVEDAALGKELHRLWPLRRPVYVNRLGKIALQVKGEDSDDFSEGLAAVSVNDKWGFIDPRGKWVIPPRFDRVDGFSDGLVAVSTSDKWGYADRAGNIVIRPQFTGAGRFHEGVAVVSLGETFDFYNLPGHPQKGIIDRNGKWIVQPVYESINGFSEGLARVWGPKNGLIDRRGRLVLDLSAFRCSGPFSEGLIMVEKDERCGYIDVHGKWVIRPQFGWGEEFSEGMAVVTPYQPTPPDTAADDVAEMPPSLRGYIDRSGKVVIRPQFAEAGRFRNGLAAVRPVKTEGCYGKGDRWGYSDTTGKMVIPLIHNEAWQFDRGLAWAHRGGKLNDLGMHQPPGWKGGQWQLIDTTGRAIWTESENLKGK
jgi:hypothetical protein